MAWFEKFCRNAGLMIHGIVKPLKGSPTTKRTEYSRKTEEKRVNDKVTLRRTTIDEIEVKRDAKEKPG